MTISPEMSRKRKISASNLPIKVEVKEENIYNDEIIMARGRLKGILQELIEISGNDTDSADEDKRNKAAGLAKKGKVKRRKSEAPQTQAVHQTFVMKLFDRSVDLARFEEDTPLYPICRAWMANQPRNPQLIIKRRVSTPERDSEASMPWNGMCEVHRLPPPRREIVSRIPSPLPEQIAQSKEEINFNYEVKPPVPKDVLIKNHLERWAKVKKKWQETSNKNEERFQASTQVLTAIYNKAQETLG